MKGSIFLPKIGGCKVNFKSVVGGEISKRADGAKQLTSFSGEINDSTPEYFSIPSMNTLTLAWLFAY